ncbi:MAG: trypsin-like peptidase domain-containing protein [Patescibacteria group bacterium]
MKMTTVRLSFALFFFLVAAVLTNAPLSLAATQNSYPNVDKATEELKKKIAAATPKKIPAKPATVKKAAPVKPLSVLTPSLSQSQTIATVSSSSSPISKRSIIPGPELNAKTRNALVNIICVTRSGGYLHPISGSGVIIDPRGVILTNAHVAQYMLLENYLVPDFVSCTIRTGSPAETTYRARLLYLPETWVKANAKNLVSTLPQGTGENDYALLAITSSATGNPLPTSFPYLSPDVLFETPSLNYPVLLAGYPAEYVGSIATQRNLYALSSASKIERGYYFPSEKAGSLDLLSLGGNILAQGGSSGGAVVDHYTGTLLGILVTTTAGTKTSEKELNGITLSHIDRSILAETGKGLSAFLAGDILPKVHDFATHLLPRESQLLIDAISK